jgi:hypothetical protein
MDRLFTLIELHRQAQQATSRELFAHIIVNETRKLIAYDEAIFWRGNADDVSLESVSGNATLDKNSPYGIAVRQLIKKSLADMTAGQMVYTLPPLSITSMPDRAGMHAVILRFCLPDQKTMGGLWLLRPAVFQEAEQQILQELSYGYSAGMAIHTLRFRQPALSVFRTLKRRPALLALVLLVAAIFPVRLSVTAPVEIVAQDAVLVTIPFEGTIEQVMVSPGDTVKADQPLARLEQSTLQSRMDMAQEALSVAQAGLARLRREALANPEKRVEMGALQSEIALKKIEYDYAKSLLNRSDILSPRNGIAIFADKNMLLGKPVTTGDILMQIAGTQNKELLIRVPADALIPLSGDEILEFHMNARPLKTYHGTIKTMGYQASEDVDGLLTYKIRGNIADGADDTRIGWKGTAKITGKWTVLSYSLLRRPLVTLRRTLGI